MTAQGELTGKVVVITGAAGGIGSATARRFAYEGAVCLLVDRDRAPLEDLATETGGHPYLLDLRDEQAIDAFVDQAAREHGRLDVLVHIAGVFVGSEGAVEESSRKTWDLSLDVNLRATHHLTARVLPHLVANGGGAIVTTSSAQARAADIGWSSYGIAKAGWRR